MVAVENLCIRQGGFRLDNVNFDVPAGSYAVLMGRTGSGKTTILETICGLRRCHGGAIRVAGADVTHQRPGNRGIGYVPQDGAMFSSMTVRQNLGFALQVRNWAPSRIDQRVEMIAERLGIRPLLDRSTTALSGGEIQRVALGRALAFDPPALLLDEPLSALDDQTRTDMHAVLESLAASGNITVLHVTHNAADAERLADLVLVLEDGQVRTSPDKSGRVTRSAG